MKSKTFRRWYFVLLITIFSNTNLLLAETFDFTNATASGGVISQTVSGVTVTATTNTGALGVWDGKLYDYTNTGKWMEFSFSKPIEVSSFYIGFYGNTGDVGYFTIEAYNGATLVGTYASQPVYADMYGANEPPYKVTYTGLGYGAIDKIKVIQNGTGSVTFGGDTIEFISNNAPTINIINNFSVNEDFNSNNIMVTVADADADDLKISVDVISGSGIITIPITQTDWIPAANYALAMPMQIRSLANKNGIVKLKITVTDGSGASSNRIFNVTVNSIDDAPVANNMAAIVGANSQEAFDTFTPSFFDVDGHNPVKLRIVNNPTLGYFQKTNDNWVTEINISAPFDVNMSDLANYRFNASGLDGVSTDVNWSIMTSIDGTIANGLWSNEAVGVVTIIDSINNNAPIVNIVSAGLDINNTIVSIDEDHLTNPIYINFSDDYTPEGFLVGLVQSSDNSKVSLSDGDFNITRIADNNVSIIIKPKSNVYGDVNITLGAFDGDKNSTKSFTLRINKVNDLPQTLSFQKTINEDNNYSFSTLNPATIYDDSNDSSQDVNETYPEIFNIISLPLQGKLHLGDGIALHADTNLSLSDLSSLVYSPQKDNFTNVTFNWKAYDGEDWSIQNIATFNINPVNDKPIITSTPIITATKDTQYTYNLSASDVDMDALSWSATAGTSIPSWLTLEENSTLLQGVPTIFNGAIRDTNISLIVNDGHGGSEVQNFIIVISGLGAHDLDLSSNTIVENTSNFNIGTLSAIVENGTTIKSWSLVNGYGDNNSFSISGTTLSINESPNYETKSSYDINVEVTDSNNVVITKVFVINVINIRENDGVTDSDGDGIPDSEESEDGNNWNDIDSDADKDGILDKIEYENKLDTDNDGIENWKDLDSDDDGIKDNGKNEGVEYEGLSDLDGDGIPNYKDSSSINPDKKATIDTLNDITEEHFLGTNVSTDEIISTLIFTKPQSAIENDVNIEWSTESIFDVSDANSLYLTIENNNTATVHRSKIEDIVIRLNVTIAKGTYSAKKSFILTIVKQNTNKEAVDRAWKAFDWFKIKKDNKYQFAIRTNLDLNTIGLDGVTISWLSDNEMVITKEGIVNRASDDTTVLLTATFKKGNETRDKTGTVIVKKELINCNDILTKAQSQLKIEDILGSKNRSADSVIDNLTLGSASDFNLEDKDNLTLTYISNNIALNVNGNIGEVGRHTSLDKEVQLRAEIERIGCEEPIYKTFDFIIKANDKDVTRAIINDINDTVSINNTMVMHFDIALSNDYNYNDASATNTFIVESKETSIISSGGSRESTLPKQLISMNNPDTLIENILTKLHTNGIIENIIDVKDTNNNDEIKQNIIKSEKIGSTISRHMDGSLEINATINGREAIMSSDKNGILSNALKTASGLGKTTSISNMKGTEIILTDSNILKTIAPSRVIINDNINKTYDIEIKTASNGISSSKFKISDNNNNGSQSEVLVNINDEESTSTIGENGDLNIVSKIVNGISAGVYIDQNGYSNPKFIVDGVETSISKTAFKATNKVNLNISIETINNTLQIIIIAPSLKNEEIKF